MDEAQFKSAPQYELSSNKPVSRSTVGNRLKRENPARPSAWLAKTLRGMDGIKPYYFHSKFHLAQIEANAEMPALADRLSRTPVKPLTWSESGRRFIGLGQRGLLSSVERIERWKQKPRSLRDDVTEDFNEKAEEAFEEDALDDDADDGI